MKYVVKLSPTEYAFLEYGHNGYTGTIAEKRTGYVMFTAANEFMTVDTAHNVVAEVFAGNSSHRLAKSVNDKYGPAGCIALSKTEFMFFGWAAS